MRLSVQIRPIVRHGEKGAVCVSSLSDGGASHRGVAGSEMLGISFPRREHNSSATFDAMFRARWRECEAGHCRMSFESLGHAYLEPHQSFLLFFGSNGRPPPREMLARLPFAASIPRTINRAGARTNRYSILVMRTAAFQPGRRPVLTYTSISQRL